MSRESPALPNLSMPLNPKQILLSEAQMVDLIQGEDQLHNQVDAYESSSNTLTSSFIESYPSDVLKTSNQKRPVIFLVPAFIQQQQTKKFFTALLDTGSDTSFIHERCIPSTVKPIQVKPKSVVGLHQTQEFDKQVTLRDITLPEFTTTKVITTFDLIVSNHDTTPDIILGNDFLSSIGLIPDPVSQTIKWFDHIIPWKNYTDFPQIKFKLVQHLLFSQEEQEDVLETQTAALKEAQYTAVDPAHVAAQQKHLSPEQQADLAALLHKFPQLFSGKLGLYPHRKVHLELQPNAVPVRKRPYAVANAHRHIYLAELNRLCEIGVLRKTGASEWGAPSFIIPKKDGTP